MIQNTLKRTKKKGKKSSGKVRKKFGKSSGKVGFFLIENNLRKHLGKVLFSSCISKLLPPLGELARTKVN